MKQKLLKVRCSFCGAWTREPYPYDKILENGRLRLQQLCPTCFTKTAKGKFVGENMTAVLEFKRVKVPEPEKKPKSNYIPPVHECRYCGNALYLHEVCQCGQAEPHCRPCHFLLAEKGMIR